MKRLLILILLIIFLAPTKSNATYVRGYMRANGTYVMPHYRSNADFTRLNNYSTKGNFNPYTGKQGTVNYTPYLRTNNVYKPYKSRITQPNYYY